MLIYCQRFPDKNRGLISYLMQYQLQDTQYT